MTWEIKNLSLAEKSKILNKMLGCSLAWHKTKDGPSSEPGSTAKIQGGSASPQADDINRSALGEEGRQLIVHFFVMQTA